MRQFLLGLACAVALAATGCQSPLIQTPCGGNHCARCQGGAFGGHQGGYFDDYGAGGEGAAGGHGGLLRHHARDLHRRGVGDGQGLIHAFNHPYGMVPIPKLPHGYHKQINPPGPPVGTYAYPYYTTRGPRDFLMGNPPPIGR